MSEHHCVECTLQRVLVLKGALYFLKFPFPVVVCYIAFSACKWSAKAKIHMFLPEGVSLPHTSTLHSTLLAKRRDISKQFTNPNRAGQLTNQSRLGSGFRRRVKRGAAAQAV